MKKLVKVNMANTKLNVYKTVLQEVCEKFSEAEEYIKKRNEELCKKKEISAEEVTYLFTNNHKFD